MKKTYLQYIGLGLVLLLILGVSVYCFKKMSGSESASATTTLHIAFHKEDSLTCTVTEDVKRVIPHSTDVADSALHELFKGPTEKEIRDGLSSTFEPSFALATIFLEKEARPLGTYYRGVSIENDIATVDFTSEALSYLNGPACLQAAVKFPIIETLLNIPSIKYVEFSIDGKIYTEWDA